MKSIATMNQPKLLLLDEHTATLDPKTAAKVLDLFTQASGGAVSDRMVLN